MTLHCREVPCLADQMIHSLVGLLLTHPEVPGLPVSEGETSQACIQMCSRCGAQVGWQEQLGMQSPRALMFWTEGWMQPWKCE